MGTNSSRLDLSDLFTHWSSRSRAFPVCRLKGALPYTPLHSLTNPLILWLPLSQLLLGPCSSPGRCWTCSPPPKMCCSVGFARSLGMALVPLALCSIVANLLLLFPMGTISYMEENKISQYIWYFGGLGGGGVLMMVPAVVFITLGKCDCCWNQSLMMCGSVLAAVIGLLGSTYSFVISGFALFQGPLCFGLYGWSYPFDDQTGRYLLEPESWSRCTQPANIVEWNVTLLCVLLGLSVLEFIICLCQIGNGLVNAVCRPCCYKQEYSLNA
ncbi:hypothetical protein NL108_007567 [Boleophthalmus pectinirostris]|uniref:transmembrane 4 L6 family member 18 n=1 Tax=Boleophthalmus pectinirostris TaxID=150288 RepID=UPI002431DA0E|nr:transmembrane 4 L6 family member 18 [Boleophthalmus pectinirostris]XP_055020822.1 transmembrane 4 L6 family member 18 [Boleophthalmus pectinirostris]KAJ0065362.1 hypothetical protein NL108_007567 [Boleophthalmus pectinirostris]